MLGDEEERARREHADMMKYIRGLFVAAAVFSTGLTIGYRAMCAISGQP